MFQALLVLALTIPEQTAFKPLLKNPDIEITMAKSQKEPWIKLRKKEIHFFFIPIIYCVKFRSGKF